MSTSIHNFGTQDVPEPIAHVMTMMAGFGGDWALCGGWAVDAWLDRQTREHKDTDIAVFVDAFDAVVAHFPDWRLIIHDEIEPDDDQPWAGRRIALPAHIHAYLPDGSNPELELCLNERQDGEWLLSRQPRIVLPEGDWAIQSAWRLPTLTPEAVLFYKSKDRRPHDEADFRRLLPLLSEIQSRWLREAIEAVDVKHPWLPWLD